MNIDVAAQLGAVRRGVEHGTRDGRPVHTVTASRTYETTPDDLWDALTNAERIPRWFLPVTGELREGGRFQLEGNAGGEILACTPPRHLAVTWEFGGGVSWLDVELAAESEAGTRLELRHVVPDDDHWRQFGPGAVGVGWDLALVGLAEHVAAGPGVAVDRAEAAAWMMSPGGTAFIEGSSEGWRSAAVAGGADAGEAAAAAARTMSAYTGAPQP